MQKLAWQNANGDILDLTKKPYGITNWEGFANTSLNIQSQQVPFQDGAVFLDALMEPRELSVTLAIYDGNDLEKRYQYRRELIHTLNPKLGEGYLIYTNDFISKRIKCVAQIPLFETHNSNTSGTPKASLSWTACEPYWEDLEETAYSLNLGSQKIIENNGDVPCGVNVKIYTDNITNPKLANLSENKNIALNGNFEKNIHINTNVGQKRVTEYDEEYKTINFGFAITEVCYSEKHNLYVGVSTVDLTSTQPSSVIITSKNGVEWSYDFYTELDSAKSVNYFESKDLFFICGLKVVENVNRGAFLKSSDGENWDLIITPTNYQINEIAYSESLNLFVAVCSNASYITSDSVILTSSDGINWSVAYTSVESNLTSIVYAENLHRFVAVGNGVILYSNDGVNWVSQSINYRLCNVVYSGSLFVSNGRNRPNSSESAVMYTSSDGINWDEQVMDHYGVYILYRPIKYIKTWNLFVVCAGNKIYTSSDGINWSSKQYTYIEYNVSTSEKGLINCCYSEVRGQLIIWGYAGLLLYTTNLQNTTLQNITKGIEFYNCYFKYSKALKKVYGIYNTSLSPTHSAFMMSDDCIDWELKSRYLGLIIGSYRDIVYAENKELFVAVTNQRVAKSSDGITWDVTTLPSSILKKSVCYSENLELFVMCGENGFILTSSDATNWEEQTSGTEVDLNYVYYDEEKAEFYIGGNNGVILKSSNGINWDIVPTNLTIDIVKLGYYKTQGLYIVVGNVLNESFSLIGKIYSGVTLESLQLNLDLASTVSGEYQSEGINDMVINENRQEVVIVSYTKLIVSKNGLYFMIRDSVSGAENLSNLKIIFNPNYDRYAIFCSHGLINVSVNIEEENIIQTLDNESNITLGVKVGKNEFVLTSSAGEATATISFRQKYIGV